MSSSLDLLDRLFAALARENIRYCVWKSVHDIPSGLAGHNDLDILVEPNQFQQFVQLLGSFGFIRNDAIFPRHYRFVEDYFGLDDATGSLVKIQLYKRVVTGSLHAKQYSPPLESLILDSRIEFKDTGVMAVSESLDNDLNKMRLALKIRLRDFVLKLIDKDVVSLRLKAEQSRYSAIDSGKGEPAAGSEKLSEYLQVQAPNSHSFSAWVSYQRQLKNNLVSYRTGSELQVTIEIAWRELSRFMRRLARYMGHITVVEHRTFKNRGLIVVFLGQDGAGKTTTLSLISKEFKKHFDVVNIYLGSGDGKASLVRLPMLWLYKRLINSGRVKTRAHTDDNVISNSTANQNKAGASSSVKSLMFDATRLFWVLLVCMERRKKCRQLLRAYSAGKLILADRMPQTQISDGPDTLRAARIKALPQFGKVGAFVERYEKHTFKLFETLKPELVIKMVVDPAEAVRRKPNEVTEAFSLKSRLHIESLNLGKNTLVIDNTSNFDANKIRIMKAIWHAAP